MSKRPINMLDRLSVNSPCSEDWDAMSGNEQARFCSHCAASVHNLSALTRAEAMALVRKSQGRLCVRYRRADGLIQTATENLHSIKRRASRIAAGAFTATLSLCASVAAQSPRAAAPAAADNVQIATPSDSARPERQSDWDGTFGGNIIDPQGAVVPGVKVTLIDEQTKIELTTTTDNEGAFRFQSLSPGSYSLTTEAAFGLRADEMRNIKLPAADGNNSAFTLTVVPDGETVTVGGAMIVEPKDALVGAAFRNDLQAVRELIASGVDVNVFDEETGETALMQAVINGNQEMARALLAAGADAGARSERGLSALLMLNGDTTTEMVWTLIRAGAKVNRRNNDGLSPLMVAAEVNNEPVVLALLDAGAKLNARDDDGRTALVWAAEYGRLESVRALLRAGADVNRKTKDNETALSLARENEHSDIAKLLEDYGAR
ncbi:MAG TPA: ankyrin repeat domain-containing protein [Pyrinomonadaceae bacterium]